ncbi:MULTISPECIES: hypothetical protein [unclassified Nonomuraea]|uniref:hypothetical protein n=1 Tax=unclassified Nonomuraea TaxID=2593643 RepID=UPI0035C2269F
MYAYLPGASSAATRSFSASLVSHTENAARLGGVHKPIKQPQGNQIRSADHDTRNRLLRA